MVFIAVWLCVAAFSVLAGLLAVRGDIVIARDDLRQTRLWLVREEGSRGLGFSSARFVSGDAQSDRACVETRVRFLLWQSSQPTPGLRYCECYRRVDGQWQYSGACPG